MALSTALVWECRASGASDNNGGGFKAGATGTDRSQQNAAQVAIDNSTITTSITANVITFTGYTPTSADVGNVVQMLTGTNVTAGTFYEITAQTATTWTVTGAAALPTSGTTTNATGNMGGALATLAKLASAMVASNKAYVTGAFTSTATITFAQQVVATASAPPTRLIGYGATRGDATHATLTCSTNTGISAINPTGQGFRVEQIDVDCANLGTSRAFNFTSGLGEAFRCKAANFTDRGFIFGSGNCLVAECEATGGGSSAFAVQMAANSQVIDGWFHDNACTAVLLSGTCTANGNLITNNSGATSDGIRTFENCVTMRNTIHNQGRHGIACQSDRSDGRRILQNILTSNGGFGVVGASSTAQPAHPDYDGNAYWNNTSGARSLMDSTAGLYGVAPYTNTKDANLSGSPYVGPTTGSSANFALNSTAGAGGACRAAAVPATWPGNTGTAGFLDLGAVQHADSGTGGGGPGYTLVVRGQNVPAY